MWPLDEYETDGRVRLDHAPRQNTKENAPTDALVAQGEPLVNDILPLLPRNLAGGQTAMFASCFFGWHMRKFDLRTGKMDFNLAQPLYENLVPAAVVGFVCAVCLIFIERKNAILYGLEKPVGVSLFALLGVITAISCIAYSDEFIKSIDESLKMADILIAYPQKLRAYNTIIQTEAIAIGAIVETSCNFSRDIAERAREVAEVTDITDTISVEIAKMMREYDSAVSGLGDALKIALMVVLSLAAMVMLFYIAFTLAHWGIGLEWRRSPLALTFSLSWLMLALFGLSGIMFSLVSLIRTSCAKDLLETYTDPGLYCVTVPEVVVDMSCEMFWAELPIANSPVLNATLYKFCDDVYLFRTSLKCETFLGSMQRDKLCVDIFNNARATGTCSLLTGIILCFLRIVVYLISKKFPYVSLTVTDTPLK